MIHRGRWWLAGVPVAAVCSATMMSSQGTEQGASNTDAVVNVVTGRESRPVASQTAASTPQQASVPPICMGAVEDKHVPASVATDGTAITFTLDGQKKHRYIKGFNFRAFITDNDYALQQVAALAASAPEDAVFYQQSYDATFAYGIEQIAALKSWEANTVRFQVSQTFVMRGSTDYLHCLVNAVRTARNAGLLVILAMQWQKNPNDTGQAEAGLNKRMPTDLTRRAWQRVDQEFAEDPGIIYDLFNEPYLPLHDRETPFTLASDAADKWRIWKSGDAYKSQPEGFIGLQNLVFFMRDTLRTDKLLIAEGLNLGDSFEGVPANGLLSDRIANKLAYSVHPYARGYVFGNTVDQQRGYAKRWGFMPAQRGVPLIVTEWLQNGFEVVAATAPPSQEPNNQAPGTRVGYRLALDLVNYVNANAIPMVASAFDVDGPINVGIKPQSTGNVYVPGNFDAWFASPRRAADNSSGILLCRFFRRGYVDGAPLSTDHLKSAKLPENELSTSPCLRQRS